MVAAKDEPTYVALQRQFASRLVEKRYVAWVEGDVRGADGIISLPLRGDVDDRPRQVVDDEHGKPATTTWRVLARSPGRTKLALSPLTGRTQINSECTARTPAGSVHPLKETGCMATPGRACSCTPRCCRSRTRRQVSPCALRARRPLRERARVRLGFGAARHA